MPYELQLEAVPNQRLNLTTGDGADFWEVELKSTNNGALVASIWRNGGAVVHGARVLPNRPIIPYLYREAGNFIVVSNDDEYPSAARLGVQSRLYYYTAEELAELRGDGG
jgi:hypothetical protein